MLQAFFTRCPAYPQNLGNRAVWFEVVAVASFAGLFRISRFNVPQYNESIERAHFFPYHTLNFYWEIWQESCWRCGCLCMYRLHRETCCEVCDGGDEIPVCQCGRLWFGGDVVVRLHRPDMSCDWYFCAIEIFLPRNPGKLLKILQTKEWFSLSLQ